MADLDWDRLRIFLATARTGSLRSASRSLGVNHATVRRAVEGLEASLSTRLFDRSVGGLSLTQPGEAVLRHAEEIERQTRQIERRLFGLDASPSGTVRVSIPPSFTLGFLAPILASFSEAYPDIDLQIIATNKVSDLALAEADVSIRSAFEVEDDVVGRRLVQYTICAFATPDYLAARPGLTPGDGHQANWIGFGKDQSWVAETPFPKARVRHILPEVFAQVEAAAHGAGMIWIPAFLGDTDDRLMRVPGVAAQPNRSIWILLHGDLRNTARVRAFVDHASAEIGKDRKRFLA